jgi:branched-chain amino acid transport system permease protein
VRRAVGASVALAGPLALVLTAGWIGSGLSASRQLEFENALVNTTIVVALYVFIGNSGVISFGHISFVAVGAYLAGILTLDATEKNFVLPSLYGWLRHTHVATPTSFALAAAAGGAYALAVGLPLMRLSGLPAGIATFAVLGITYNVLRNWEKIGPAAQALTSVPEVGVWTLTIGALLAIVVAFGYQSSRPGRMLRATREDPGAAQAAGINVYRQRLLAFTISGALAGFAGGLLMHELGTITTDQVYLELTFLTLAMLVVGGVNSLFGAVVGGLLISGLDSFLGDAENGIHVGIHVNLPDGTRLVVLGALMALILIVRPSGLTGGRELVFPRRSRI